MGPDNLVFDSKQAGLYGWVSAGSGADGLLGHDWVKVADGNYVIGVSSSLIVTLSKFGRTVWFRFPWVVLGR